MTDSIKDIADRLLRTRLALGFETQAEFCTQVKLAPNVYNPYETGERRITLNSALKIRQRFGVPLDWIYCGDDSRLPAHLYKRLQEAA